MFLKLHVFGTLPQELKTKLEQERKHNAEVRKDLDARTDEAQRLTADLAAARQQACRIPPKLHTP